MTKKDGGLMPTDGGKKDKPVRAPIYVPFLIAGGMTIFVGVIQLIYVILQGLYFYSAISFIIIVVGFILISVGVRRRDVAVLMGH